jgi:hypothetical protein
MEHDNASEDNRRNGGLVLFLDTTPGTFKGVETQNHRAVAMLQMIEEL